MKPVSQLWKKMLELELLKTRLWAPVGINKTTRRVLTSNLIKATNELCWKKAVLLKPCYLFGISRYCFADVVGCKRENCGAKISWNKVTLLPTDIKKNCLFWSKSLPNIIKLTRGLKRPNQKMVKIELHGFGDASNEEYCSEIYRLIKHAGGTIGLLTAKSRIAARKASILCLELIAGHMVAYSLEHMGNALSKYPITSTFGWPDNSCFTLDTI